METSELTFGNTAAEGYDQGFAEVARSFIPALLQAANVSTGQRVLDVATGTGLVVHVARPHHRPEDRAGREFGAKAVTRLLAPFIA